MKEKSREFKFKGIMKVVIEIIVFFCNILELYLEFSFEEFKIFFYM